MTSPRYSIITYHHDPEYLTHLWKYLSNNESPSSWEWIIGYSIDDLGKLSLERIKQLSTDIPNISLLKIPSAKDLTIGKALNTCAEKARGTYLLFFSDQALPSSKLFSVLDSIETVKFVSGDFAYRKEGAAVKEPTLLEDFWETYEHQEELDGTYLAYKSPPITARTLLDPALAPRGLLMWERASFFSIGGLSPSLNIGYFIEMMCRSYIHNLDMVITESECLAYLNPKKPNPEEVKIKASIGGKYFYGLIAEESIRNELPRVALVSPPNETPKDHKVIEWTGAQLIYKGGNAIEANSIGIVHAADFLQFVPQREVIFLIDNIWRILAPRSWFISSTPSSRGAGAFGDPRQASYWNNLTFSFFCLSKEIKVGFKGLFQHTRVWENFPTNWHKENGVPYVQADLMKLELPMVSEDSADTLKEKSDT